MANLILHTFVHNPYIACSCGSKINPAKYLTAGLRISSSQRSGGLLKEESNAAANDASTTTKVSDLISPSDEETGNILRKDFLIYSDFISETEEKSLFDEVEPYMKRLKYESSHWDDAIHGYRETERKVWTQKNKEVLDRVRQLVFPPGLSPMAYVHVLDLQAAGVIKPHIDSSRYCGDVIAGLSLLSDSVMRLVNDKAKHQYADILLPKRSLYVMKGAARYEFTHEILAGDKSIYNNKFIERGRRIAIICRNEPSESSDS